MKENNIHLILAVFGGQDSAETAVNQLSKREKNAVTAVVIQKDADGKLNFHDVGHTPTKDTVGGFILGGVIGLLTGGTGLVLGALGAVIGHHRGKKKLTTKKIPEQLSKVAGSLGLESSAIIVVVKGELRAETITTIEALGGDIFSSGTDIRSI